MAANTLTASALATDAREEIADQVWDEAGGRHTAAGSFGRQSQVIRDGTAQAGAAGTITLDASASGTDDFYNNTILQIVGGTGAGQSRIISDYVGATKVASVNGNWITNPASDSLFVIRAFGAIPGASAPTAGEVADAVWDEARSGHTTGGSFGEGVASVQGNVTGSTASVTGNVGGNVTGSVGSVAAGGITASSIATGAVDADAIAADAVTEIQSGLATAAALATVDDFLDTEIADIQARLPAALVSGRIDASVGAMAANTLTASALATDAREEIADQVWDEAIAGHLGAGSTGAALNAAGSAGDPWTTPLPGAYGAGTAGNIVGTNLDATVSSRATPAQVNTEVDTALADVRLDELLAARIRTSTAPLRPR